MTTFAPDLPDWTSSTTGGQVYTDFQTATAGGELLFILTGVSSLVLNIAAPGTGDAIQAQVAFYPPGSPGFTLATLDIVVTGNADSVLNISMELPAYGAQMLLVNNSPAGPIDVGVVTSNRDVAAPRYFGFFAEGAPFLQSGPFVAATKQVLSFFGGGNNGFLSNGEITAVVTSSDAGRLYFRRTDLFGDVVDIIIGVVAAAADQVFTMPLPQAGGSIVFEPTTSNAGGTITAVVYGP